MFRVYVVDEFELTMLQLIYEDLSKRSPNNLISRETFNAYFRVIVCISNTNLGIVGRINI
jgi:hypothetical protein